MSYRVAVAAIIFAFASLPAPLLAQPPAGRGGPPAPPKNLQVLPKDSSRADVLTTMRSFTAGLGVECNYCHVQEGQGGRNDMALDDKATKITARVMMQMVDQNNRTIAAAVAPKTDAVKVQCATCHRGKAIPENPPPPAPPAPR